MPPAKINQKNKVDILLSKINFIERISFVNKLATEDSYCLNILQSLINSYPIIPFTGSSLRPFCLLHIINDIIVNERKQIIEFGSGISTILIARLIKRNKLKAEILSIEHDIKWVRTLNTILRKEGLLDKVKIVCAPLKKCNLSIDSNEWYDTAILKKAIKAKKFDMVIVDGPPAWESKKEISRYPALPFLFKSISSKSSIYLDDADRIGEQYILRIWGEEFSMKFQISGGTLAHCYVGESFYTKPFAY